MKTEAPMLNPACPVCQSPNRAALVALRELGQSIEEIADGSGFDMAIVEEHFAAHLSGGTDDTGKVLRDSEELYFSSVLSGNMSAAASALSVRARIVAEKNRTKATERKQKSLLGDADPCDPHNWPAELAEFIQAVQDDIVRRVVDFEATT